MITVTAEQAEAVSKETFRDAVKSVMEWLDTQEFGKLDTSSAVPAVVEHLNTRMPHEKVMPLLLVLSTKALADAAIEYKQKESFLGKFGDLIDLIEGNDD